MKHVQFQSKTYDTVMSWYVYEGMYTRLSPWRSTSSINISRCTQGDLPGGQLLQSTPLNLHNSLLCSKWKKSARSTENFMSVDLFFRFALKLTFLFYFEFIFVSICKVITDFQYNYV